MLDLLSRLEDRREEIGVLLDRQRAVASVSGGDEPQAPRALGDRELLLLVARCETLALGHDPDLDQPHRIVGRRVELAVPHTRPRGHALHVAGADDRTRAQACLLYTSPS